MNRIIQHLGRECRCCAAREYVERCKSVAAEIEAKADGIFEFIVPTVYTVAEDGQRGILPFLNRELDRVLDLDTAAQDVAHQLRELADRLWLAADKIGGAA